MPQGTVLRIPLLLNLLHPQKLAVPLLMGMLPQLAVVVWAEALVEQAPIPVTVGQPAEQQAREFLPQIALPLLMGMLPGVGAAALPLAA